MPFADEDSIPRPRIRLYAAVGVFFLAMGAPPLIARLLSLSVPAMLLLYLPAFAAFWWMCAEMTAHSASRGTMTIAGRAYLRRMPPLTIAYVAALLAAIYAYEEYRPHGLALAVLALLPALPIVGFIWAMARFLIDESDEYQRRMMAQRALIATAFTLVVTTIWGFLELFKAVPHVPVFAAFILWCLGLGLGSAYVRPIR